MHNSDLMKKPDVFALIVTKLFFGANADLKIARSDSKDGFTNWEVTTAMRGNWRLTTNTIRPELVLFTKKAGKQEDQRAFLVGQSDRETQIFPVPNALFEEEGLTLNRSQISVDDKVYFVSGKQATLRVLYGKVIAKGPDGDPYVDISSSLIEGSAAGPIDNPISPDAASLVPALV